MQKIRSQTNHMPPVDKLAVILIIFCLALITGVVIPVYFSNIYIFVGLILGIVLLIISLKYPLIILCLYPISFIDTIQDNFTLYGLSPAIYLVIIASIVWLYQLLSRRISLHNIPKLWMGALIILPSFLLVRFLIGGSNLRIILTFSGSILIAIIYTTLLTTKNRILAVLGSIIVISVLLSTAQVFTLYFGKLYPILQQTLQHREFQRIYGLARDPNYGALTMGIGFCYTLSLALFDRKKFRKINFVYFVVIFILAIGILLSGSRAGLLATFIISIFIIGITFKLKYVLYSLPLLLLIIPFFQTTFLNSIIDNYITRLSPEYLISDPSNIQRFSQFGNGIEEILNRGFLFGIGDAAFTFHNTFLDLYSFGGFIAFASFLTIFILALLLNFKILFGNSSNFKQISLGNVSGILFIFLVGSTIGLSFEKIIWVIVSISMATFVVIGVSKTSD